MTSIISQFNETVETIRKEWGWFLALGLGLIALGLFAIVYEQIATLASVSALGIMLALCQGIDLVRVGVMQWRLPYRYTAAAGFGAVMLTGALAHAFLPALAVAVVLDAGLARMLARGV